MWTPWPSTFLYGKRVVEWMDGTSAGRRLFGFAKAALCTLADEKTTEKSWNSTWFVSSLWTGQKYWTVELYEQNVQSIFLSRSKIRSVQFDRSLSEQARKKGCEWITLRIKLDLSTQPAFNYSIYRQKIGLRVSTIEVYLITWQSKSILLTKLLVCMSHTCKRPSDLQLWKTVD